MLFCCPAARTSNPKLNQNKKARVCKIMMLTSCQRSLVASNKKKELTAAKLAKRMAKLAAKPKNTKAVKAAKAKAQAKAKAYKDAAAKNACSRAGPPRMVTTPKPLRTSPCRKSPLPGIPKSPKGLAVNLARHLVQNATGKSNFPHL